MGLQAYCDQEVEEMKADGSLPSTKELMARHEALMSLRKSREQDHRVYIRVGKVKILMALEEEIV